jgi:hypothetical protein
VGISLSDKVTPSTPTRLPPRNDRPSTFDGPSGRRFLNAEALALALTIDLARQNATTPPTDGQRRACALATSSADTAAMLLWARLASGQINMRKVDGWQVWPQGHRSAN